MNSSILSLSPSPSSTNSPVDSSYVFGSNKVDSNLSFNAKLVNPLYLPVLYFLDLFFSDFLKIISLLSLHGVKIPLFSWISSYIFLFYLVEPVVECFTLFFY